ncbi:long-chain-fatty-acid--CoA ligase [Roseovarius sp. A-2]|uniref:class I adenylate-forming enzyme family protein n=1 Tax=Roseovarius sp. A-2 TaxID=1570360 RepID=UPI0009B580BD|nr:class I adenylate-forming enzyme family protein [Roseovarius sp. A-2]GAW37097.1 long-chain-fatty-acid--CoA ligase [Roseovarius sp. A-2]
MNDTDLASLVAARHAEIEAISIAPDLRDYLTKRFERYGPERALNFFEDNTELSFSDLGSQAWALADALQRRGIGKGTRVAVMMPNRVEFPVTWCALMLMGAVIVPVNVRYTSRELAYVCTDSEAEALILDASLTPVLDGWADRPGRFRDADVITVGKGDGSSTDWDALRRDGAPDWRPDWTSDSADLANIQYTSGTTGFPKGVMLTRRYWLITAHLAFHMFTHRPHQVLAAQPFFYMDPQWLMLTAFYNGGTLHVARQASGSRFLAWCRQHKVDRALMPEVVAKQPTQPNDADNVLDTVWNFNWRGDIRHEAEKRFKITARECFGMTEIGLALYTPTEATHRTKMASCGIPLPFRQAEIRDDDCRPVVPGTIGELWIKGDGVAAAYWNKPEANAETFVDGWFRTGDLFVQDNAGWYSIVGRKKDMIRRSGENVAAREVEAVIRELPEVLEAAVLPVPDEDRGEEIKAYVILTDGTSPADLTPSQILAHCRQSLAPFKVPRFIAYADELPRTPGRKVAKHEIVRTSPDLRQGAYDAKLQRWLQ